MLTGEFCSRDVVIIGKTDSVFMASKLMREHHVGNVLVVDLINGKRIPVGILTDRDIVIRVLAQYDNFNDIRIEDIVDSKLITAYENDDLMVTIKLMRMNGVRRIPIVNRENELVGVLSVDDILDVITEQLMDIDQLIAKELKNESLMI